MSMSEFLKDEHCVTLYDNWFTQHSDLMNEVDGKSLSIKQAEERVENSQRTNLRLQDECKQLQRAQDHCHQQLSVLQELESDIRNMKSKLAHKEQELSEKATQHKTDIQNLKDFLLKEYDEKSRKIFSECDEKVRNLESLLQEEKDSRAALEEQLNDSLKEKDREMAKMSMEYESKLAQSERQKAQLMQQQQQVLNQDVMRKKMQHMKETYEKEMSSLKFQIAELQKSHSLDAEKHLQPHWQKHDISPGQSGHIRSRLNSKGRSLSMSKNSF